MIIPAFTLWVLTVSILLPLFHPSLCPFLPCFAPVQNSGAFPYEAFQSALSARLSDLCQVCFHLFILFRIISFRLVTSHVAPSHSLIPRLGRLGRSLLSCSQPSDSLRLSSSLHTLRVLIRPLQAAPHKNSRKGG